MVYFRGGRRLVIQKCVLLHPDVAVISYYIEALCYCVITTVFVITIRQPRSRFHCSGSRSWGVAYYLFISTVLIIIILLLGSEDIVPMRGPYAFHPGMALR